MTTRLVPIVNGRTLDGKWQIVPVEPLYDMLSAIFSCETEYLAMLAAAPLPDVGFELPEREQPSWKNLRDNLEAWNHTNGWNAYDAEIKRRMKP